MCGITLERCAVLGCFPLCHQGGSRALSGRTARNEDHNCILMSLANLHPFWSADLQGQTCSMFHLVQTWQLNPLVLCEQKGDLEWQEMNLDLFNLWIVFNVLYQKDHLNFIANLNGLGMFVCLYLCAIFLVFSEKKCLRKSVQNSIFCVEATIDSCPPLLENAMEGESSARNPRFAVRVT